MFATSVPSATKISLLGVNRSPATCVCIISIPTIPIAEPQVTVIVAVPISRPDWINALAVPVVSVIADVGVNLPIVVAKVTFCPPLI